MKLADFGTSVMMAGETQDNIKALCGRIHFMAPGAFSKTRGRKTDVWSLGGLLIQMATGEPPWKCLSFQGVPQLLLSSRAKARRRSSLHICPMHCGGYFEMRPDPTSDPSRAAVGSSF